MHFILILSKDMNGIERYTNIGLAGNTSHAM